MESFPTIAHIVAIS